MHRLREQVYTSIYSKLGHDASYQVLAFYSVNFLEDEEGFPGNLAIIACNQVWDPVWMDLAWEDIH